MHKVILFEAAFYVQVIVAAASDLRAHNQWRLVFRFLLAGLALRIEHRSGRAGVALQLLETALPCLLGTGAERVLHALAVGAARTRSLDDPDADADVEARKRATALAAHSFLKVRDELRALWLSLRG